MSTMDGYVYLCKVGFTGRTPPVSGSPWFGVAELRDRNHRTEIVDWFEHGDRLPGYLAPAVLLHDNLPFEYPKTVNELLNELERHDIKWVDFVFRLALYAIRSSMSEPLAVILGTPMRRVVSGGPALQHLAVWEISAADTDKLRLLASSFRDDMAYRHAIEAVCRWSVTAKVGWCPVREMRPEITQRRDQRSPMAWFRGRRVAIWGCGAVGTHVAESIVRAGARFVELVDNKTVHPGVLVRQGFDDADIGRCKAVALVGRLKRINPDIETVAKLDDLVVLIAGRTPVPDVDLIVDCTASPTVRCALESVLDDIGGRPPIAAIAIDSRAVMAMATLSMPDHSGCTLDLVRRVKIEACRDTKLSGSLEAFWPKAASSERFQPEPGCSEPTFIGSNVDLAGLSARMLNAIASAVAKSATSHTAFGWLAEMFGPVYTFSWARDYVLSEKGRGYTVRVAPEAAREMRGWARRTTRTVGPAVETGGLVFGELNEAVGFSG